MQTKTNRNNTLNFNIKTYKNRHLTKAQNGVGAHTNSYKLITTDANKTPIAVNTISDSIFPKLLYNIFPSTEVGSSFDYYNNSGVIDIIKNLPSLIHLRKEQFNGIENGDKVYKREDDLYRVYLGLDNMNDTVRPYSGELPDDLKNDKNVKTLSDSYEEKIYFKTKFAYNNLTNADYKGRKTKGDFINIPQEDEELGTFSTWYNPKTEEVRYYDKYDLDRIPMADKLAGTSYSIYGRIPKGKYKSNSYSTKLLKVHTLKSIINQENEAKLPIKKTEYQQGGRPNALNIVGILNAQAGGYPGLYGGAGNLLSSIFGGINSSGLFTAQTGTYKPLTNAEFLKQNNYSTPYSKKNWLGITSVYVKDAAGNEIKYKDAIKEKGAFDATQAQGFAANQKTFNEMLPLGSQLAGLFDLQMREQDEIANKKLTVQDFPSISATYAPVGFAQDGGGTNIRVTPPIPTLQLPPSLKSLQQGLPPEMPKKAVDMIFNNANKELFDIGKFKTADELNWLREKAIQKYDEESEKAQEKLRSALTKDGYGTEQIDTALKLIYERIDPNDEGLSTYLLEDKDTISAIKNATDILLPKYSKYIQGIGHVEDWHYNIQNNISEAIGQLDMMELPEEAPAQTKSKREYKYYKQGGNIEQQMLGYKDNSPYKNLTSQKFYTNTITMDGVGKTLIATSDNGITKILKPYSGIHYFPNASMITEVPMVQQGGRIKIRSEKGDNYQYEYDDRTDDYYVTTPEGKFIKVKKGSKADVAIREKYGTQTVGVIYPHKYNYPIPNTGGEDSTDVYGMVNTEEGPKFVRVADKNPKGNVRILNPSEVPIVKKSFEDYYGPASITPIDTYYPVYESGSGYYYNPVTGDIVDRIEEWDDALNKPVKVDRKVRGEEYKKQREIIKRRGIKVGAVPADDAYSKREENFLGRLYNKYLFQDGGRPIPNINNKALKLLLTDKYKIMPVYKNGGFTKYKSLNTLHLPAGNESSKADSYINLTPLIPIQTEKKELIVLPTGDITKVNAKKRHSQMSADEVTDIVPENSYILSKFGSVDIYKSEADQIILEVENKPYNIHGTNPTPKVKTLGDIMNKKVMKPADLARLVEQKYKIINHDDPFTIQTNAINKSRRWEYLQAIIQLSEYDKARKGIDNSIETQMLQNNVQVPQMVAKNGGEVLRANYNVPKAFEPLSLIASLGASLLGPVIGAIQNKNAAKRADKLMSQQLTDIASYDSNARKNLGLGLGIGSATTLLQNPLITPSIESDQFISQFPSYVNASNNAISNMNMNRVWNNRLDTSSMTPQMAMLLGDRYNAQALGAQGQLAAQLSSQRANTFSQYLQMRQNIFDKNAASRTAALNATRANQNNMFTTLGGMGMGYTDNLNNLLSNVINAKAAARGQNTATHIQLGNQMAQTISNGLAIGLQAYNSAMASQQQQQIQNQLNYQNQFPYSTPPLPPSAGIPSAVYSQNSPSDCILGRNIRTGLPC